MQRERDFEAPSRAVTTRRGSRPGRGLVLTLAGAVLLTAATTWTFARLQAPIVTDVTTGAMASTNRTDFDRTNLHTVSAHAAGTSSPVLVTGLPDFTGLVDQVGPSVVNIRTTEKVTPGARGGNSQNEQMLEFFRRFGIPVPPGFVPQPEGRNDQPDGESEQRPKGIGSGFVLSEDGYIMTNAHVVDGADELIVTFPDKTEYPGKIIGADKRTDVAVVKIEAKGLSPVRLGDSDRLRVGEWVMAIGSPYGLENTVTAGIVSAKARETGDFLPFIQTDVAINPGNSGGPLINMRGEVVGINSQIYSRSGGFQGISFAIPIAEAVRVSDQLREQGYVNRGRIGVSIAEVDADTAQALGMEKPTGALVRGVESGSPASKAGVEPGDVIVQFDGKAVNKSLDLPRIVGNTKPDATVSMTVIRRGKEQILRIRVGRFEREPVVAEKPKTPEPVESGAIKAVGLAVVDLTAADKKELKLNQGVRVTAVSGAAARAGLEAGDLILTVGNTQIANAAALEAILQKSDASKPLSLLFRRGQWVQYTLLRR
jgi:serine protease Do